MSADHIKKALDTARAARVAAYDAKEADTTEFHASTHIEEAWRLLTKAEGLLAQASYWQETAKEEG